MEWETVNHPRLTAVTVDTSAFLFSKGLAERN
jgi:hypothetical protein